MVKELKNKSDENNDLVDVIMPTIKSMDRLLQMNNANNPISEHKYDYIGNTKDGRRVYVSGFDSSLSMDEKIALFKERIATIFNLGAVELKTDVKKLQIKGDKFTAQKNIYGDLFNTDSEQTAKINSLYDLADILATATYDPSATAPEPSYINPNTKPKNKAHKNVKYWYKFKNNIVFDGVPYVVTFNIRDKGKMQYQYLIEFKEDKTPSLSNTVEKHLLRTDQTSSKHSIHQPEQNVNTSEQKNAEYLKESQTSGKETVPKVQKQYSIAPKAKNINEKIARERAENAKVENAQVFAKNDVELAVKSIESWTQEEVLSLATGQEKLELQHMNKAKQQSIK